jgi:eukaryotic-like serine/threonine-protein kinase
MDRESIGPYRIVDRLGAGGMGEVFLAVDTRLGRKVALKSLSDPSLDAPQARARLLREARAAAHISHPNIAAIYDVLDTGEHPCIVMEYAQGEPLSALVSRGPMECRDVVAIARQIADAVAHAHAAGVIHRDLKPANIVVAPGPLVKVLDFGLAHGHDVEESAAVETNPEITRDLTESRVGMIAGTPAYMAPEQLIGRPASALSDIYSIGATVYELLAGRRPFDGPTPAAVAWDIVSRPTPRVSDVVPSVPRALAAVVAKAMARDPADRYQSAEAMAADLQRAEQDCRPGSQPEVERVEVPPASVGARPASTGAPRVAVVAVVLAAVALFATVFIAIRIRDRPAPVVSSQFVAIVPFGSPAGDQAAAAAAAGFTEAIVSTLEGLSSVTVLSRPDARWLPVSGDARKGLLGSGATALVTGRVSGPPDARELVVGVEDASGKILATRRLNGGPDQMASSQGAAIRGIVKGLGVTLTGADQQRMQRAPACRPETYTAIASGRALLDREDVTGNPALAETTFRRAADGDPSCALAYAGLSDACWARYGAEHVPAMSDAASDAIAKAVQLDPDSPTIRMSLARVFRNTGRFELAENAIREVIRRRRRDDAPYRLLADILDRQNRTEEATAAMATAAALRPDNVINALVRGMRQYDAARYDEALVSFEDVLKRQPDNEWGRINTIAAHAQLGNFQQAIDVYESSPVKNATMRSNVGGIYLALNRCAEAAEIMREAVEMAPLEDVKRRNLGDAYACLGRQAEARQQYQEAAALTRRLLKVNKADARVQARLALYEAKCGQKDEALQRIDEILEAKPNDGEVLYKAAAVYSLLNRPTQAVERLRQAFENGYSRALARADWDLAPIRPLPGVAEMLGGRR